MRRALALMTLLSSPALWLLASPALAGPTRNLRLTTYKDFDEGEAKGTLLDSLGEVLPGLDAQRSDVGELLAFCATRLDGTLYIGTGDQGAVWAQKGKEKPRKVAKLDGVLVSALAAGKGKLFAATVPTGRVYEIDKLDAKEPRVRELGKLDADHVWALSWDEAAHTLYAATGPSGKLFAFDVDADRGTGKWRVLWSSGEKHLLSMTRGEDGALYVGSSDQAILYRVVPKGSSAEVRVVHDFEGDEVRAIWRDKDATYVAVNDFKGQSLPILAAMPSKSARTPPQAATASSGAAMSLASLLSMTSPPSRERKSRGALYRVDVDGRTEQLHALADGYFTSIARDADGTVWAGAGSNGRVYQVRADRVVATALDVPERQVLFLDLGGGDPVVGTGDAASLYHVGGAPKEALYLSKALDAQWLSRWGRVRWSGSGLEITTRTGNTQKPDATWTSWQAVSSIESYADSGSGRVQSPSGRFVQLRAKLSQKGVLRELTTYYVPQNQRARVASIEADTHGKHVTITQRELERAHSSTIALKWHVENPDDDELVYRVYFREERDPNWRALGGPEPLAKTEYAWNTDGLADGTYLVRVVASDERSNPRDEALEHELTSQPILVDNKAPEILGVEVGPKEATGHAKDAASPITQMAYAIDGGEWTMLGAKDGVFDDLDEAFAIRLPAALAPGAHTLAIRAVDSADNVGATQVTFRVK